MAKHANMACALVCTVHRLGVKHALACTRCCQVCHSKWCKINSHEIHCFRTLSLLSTHFSSFPLYFYFFPALFFLCAPFFIFFCKLLFLSAHSFSYMHFSVLHTHCSISTLFCSKLLCTQISTALELYWIDTRLWLLAIPSSWLSLQWPARL